MDTRDDNYTINCIHCRFKGLNSLIFGIHMDKEQTIKWQNH